MKTCRKCGRELPLSEFEYCRDTKSKSGRAYLRGQCRKCRRGPNDSGAVERAYRWKAKNPEKLRIHRRVLYAIETGKLQRLPCEVCGEPRVDGHHADYSEPLIVQWLCRRHHVQLHRQMRKEYERHP